MVQSQYHITSLVTKRQNVFWGWCFFVFGWISFLGFLYAAVLPPLSAIQNDRYYYMLMPITLPIIVVAVYFHWLSMELFKHA
ncbi:hypothetical protein IFM89_015041 [Coptis chinensis]|uniref:Uncharacterized protein n=1 Tax=Coptis chinensis TaxID=261450 RepID=A0A835H5A4_9MAGN|nr:hypothetical protein IFM89_015041 [Coptis chinensis]